MSGCLLGLPVGQQETFIKHENPVRANHNGVVLRACGKLRGFLTEMPPVADTGQAEAHQCEGGGFRDSYSVFVNII